MTDPQTAPVEPPSPSPAAEPFVPGRTKFETELIVRPDDIDMYQHVHASRYFDYVLAARCDQMARCYRMSMEEFARAGLGWFTRTSHFEYKRPIVLGETIVVRTWIEDFAPDGVRVEFEIRKKANGKLASDGWCHYTLIDLKTGRATRIPPSILAKYAI